MKTAWLCTIALCLTFPLVATAAPASSMPNSNYNPRVLFAPFQYQYPANRYRAADGQPGPDYWQNRADYVIHATLDPKAKTLSGSEVIT